MSLTQINTNQIEDGSITNGKFSSESADRLVWTKIDKTGAVASDVGAVNAQTGTPGTVQTNTHINIDGTAIVGSLSVTNGFTPSTLGIASGKFAVDANGNITKINNATTTWPASNTAGVLTNDGNGTLTWGVGESPLTFDAPMFRTVDNVAFGGISNNSWLTLYSYNNTTHNDWGTGGEVFTTNYEFDNGFSGAFPGSDFWHYNIWSYSEFSGANSVASTGGVASIGCELQLHGTGAGTLAWATGLSVIALAGKDNQAGGDTTVTELAGIKVRVGNNNDSKTVSNLYGLNIRSVQHEIGYNNNFSNAPITNTYGVYISNMGSSGCAAANTYQFFSTGVGKSKFVTEAADVVPLQVQVASAQTADAFQVLASNGSDVLFSIDAAGTFGGTVALANAATQIAIADNGDNASYCPVFANASATPASALISNTYLKFNPSNGQLSTASYQVTGNKLGNDVVGQKAQATLTSTGTPPSDTETVQIGTQTYTFKTTLSVGPTVPFEVLIDASGGTNGEKAAITLDNLKAAVNAGAGEGTIYSTGTTANGDVEATTNTDTTQLFLARSPGSIWNGLTSTSTAGSLSFGDTHFLNGTDPGLPASVEARIETVVTKFTWTNSNIVALGSNATGDIPICTIPAKTVVKRVWMNITGQAAGPDTLVASVGTNSTDYDNYLVDSDLMATANTIYGMALLELGTALSDTIGHLPSMTTTTPVVIHFTSTGTPKLADVTGSSGEIYIETMLLP